MNKVELSKRVSREEPRHLIVDGELWEESVGKGIPTETLVGEFWGKSIDRLAKSKLRDLGVHSARIQLSLPKAEKRLEEWEFAYAEISLDRTAQLSHLGVFFRIEYGLEFWAKPYSIAHLATAIEEVLESRSDLPFEYGQVNENNCIDGFGVFMDASSDCTIGDIISTESTLKFLSRLVEQKLLEVKGQSVTALFEFPAPIKTACEQYLLYFVQFLRDLGIQAEAELNEDARRVLFTVTPVEKNQALDQIREALEAYLQMPMASEFNVMAAQFQDISVSQLQSNILHLQSQIALARAGLELKNATIDAKNAVIALLKERMDLRLFQPVEATDAHETESLIGKVVSVKKYDFKFLQVDFPAILRKLKRLL